MLYTEKAYVPGLARGAFRGRQPLPLFEIKSLLVLAILPVIVTPRFTFSTPEVPNYFSGIACA